MVFAYAIAHMKNQKQTAGKKHGTARNVRKTSVGWMLKMLSLSLDKEMNRKLKPLGLNLAQFAILMTLHEDSGLTQVELGKRISLPGYATTRNLDSLEKAGLVKRQPHETSRRSLRVYITDDGELICRKLFPIVREVNGQLLSRLNKTEIDQIESLLAKLLSSV